MVSWRVSQRVMVMGLERAVVVVGAGHAGGRVVTCLREAGYAGRLILVGEEDELPYERPPLSKEVLAEHAAAAKGRLMERASYDEHGIELMLGCRATRINTRAKQVELSDGRMLSYSQLVLATGARARRLRIPGSDLPGVYYLRTTSDALALRDALRPGTRCCVIGAGLIGLEVAASAAKLGCEVCVLEYADRVLARVVPAQIGRFMQSIHEAHGVRIRCAVRVTALQGSSRVEAVLCEDGERFAADVVVVGIGAEPDCDLAERAGIACDNGVVVDQFGRTNAVDVFAVGDVANAWNPRYGRHQRLETWDNAQKHPETVARAICGQRDTYAPVPWAWTDQYDVNLQILDGGAPAERIVTRGSIAERKFICFAMTDQHVAAAWFVNSGGERRPLLRLIETRACVQDADLEDVRTPLRQIAAAAPAQIESP